MTKSYEQAAMDQLTLAQAGALELLEDLRSKYITFLAEQGKLGEYNAKRVAAEALEAEAKEGRLSLQEVDASVAMEFEVAEIAATTAYESADRLVSKCQKRIKALELTPAKIAWFKKQTEQETLPERLKAAQEGLGGRYGQYYVVVPKITNGGRVTTPLGQRVASYDGNTKERTAIAKWCVVEDAIAKHHLPNDAKVRDALIGALEAQIEAHRAKTRKPAPQNSGRKTMSIADQQVEIEYAAGKCYAS